MTLIWTATKKAAYVTSVALMIISASLVFNHASRAQEKEPGADVAFTAPLVTAYTPCKMPNSVTLATAGVPLPACTPATREDTQCGFGSKGRGHFTARAVATDILIEAELVGLSGCEDKQLRFVVTSRGTVNFCPDGQ